MNRAEGQHLSESRTAFAYTIESLLNAINTYSPVGIVDNKLSAQLEQEKKGTDSEVSTNQNFNET